RVELTPVAGFVPSVVMTIAVADCVHLLATYFLELRRGNGRTDALAESLRVNVQPVFLTTLTTIIGVLCLNLSDSPPYRDLGNMVALGTFFAWVFSMSFLPALLLWLPEPRPGRAASDSHPMQRFGEFVVRRHRFLLVAMGSLVIGLVSFVGNNRLTDSWTEYFDHSFELRHTIEAANTRLSGNHLVEFVLDSGESGGINNPAFLREAGAFTDWLRAQPEVAHAAGLVDVLRQLNRNMHGDDPAWYRLPERRDLAAQYLLLYELSLPEGMGLDNLIDIDRAATRLTVILYKTDSERILAMERRGRNWLAANTSSIRPLEGTSLDMVFAHIARRNIHSLLWGTALALVLISLVLVAALRSLRIGLISLVPNLAPAALAYGTWGLLVGHIDLALSIVICMSLGIVVDDTVHFLSKYLRARRERGLAPAQAIPYAFRTVGVALFTTSFVLVTGFAVLALSHMAPTRETGTLLSMTLSFALLADFLFLPPLLMLLDRNGSAGSSATTLRADSSS
ncbi:MAG: MMPL family transporter, partial [Gammaproteobacteria bacterium]|nr:MMPL family transporter [Gammaproteobacteria bacterium]